MKQSTSFKNATAELAPFSASDRLMSAVDKTPNLVAIFDEADRLIYANASFRSAYGFDDVEPANWRQIIMNAFARGRGPVLEAASVEDWLTRADTRRGTSPFRSFEADFHDGRWFLVTETMDSNGTLLLVGVDITSVKADSRTVREERDRAVRAAWTDPLTGLANRRYCFEQLEKWRARSREDASGALVMIDLDHFKEVNDEYGHEFGDRVLVDFGRFVLERIRLQDLFGRIGGEEFLLFMPDCTAKLARSRVEQLLAELANHQAILEMPSFRYSFSSGLIKLTPDLVIDAGLNAADRLLYAAKLSGRACVVSSSEL